MAVATLKAILDSSQFKRGSNVVNSQLKKMKGGVISTESAFVSLTRKIGRFGDSLGANISVAAGFSSLVEATVAMQKYETTMTSFVGSLQGAREELQYVLDTANKFGVSFAGVAAPFSKFAAAAEGFSKAEVHKVFEAFVTASSGLQLNMQEVNGVFLALQQIVSKGRISMEELRLQLAERIPGAMRLAAQAADMGMMEFEEAVRKGLVDTRTWLVDFAELIEGKFASAADVARFRLQASIMRLSNSFLVFRSRVMDVGESSQSLVTLFDAVSKKFFQNEKVIDSLGGAIGNLAGTVAKWVSGIDDSKIAGFTEGLSDLGDTIINDIGPVIGDFITTLTDPSAWAGLKDAAVSVLELSEAVGKFANVVMSLPGDILDKGLFLYAILGKHPLGRVIAAIELIKKKWKEFDPNLELDVEQSTSVIAILLEKMFGSAKEEIGGFDHDLPPVELDIPIEPTMTFPEGWTGFEELEAWREKTKKIIEDTTSSFSASSTGFSGIQKSYQTIEKAVNTTWSNIKSASADAADDMLNRQVAAANAIADTYTEILTGPVKASMDQFKNGLAGISEAMKEGVDGEALLELGDNLKFAAAKGIKEFTRMGKVVSGVLNDIAKKEKQLRDDIWKIEDDIASVRRAAAEERGKLLGEDLTDQQKYYQLIKQINSEFAQANALQGQAGNLSGDAKLRALEQSNDALERAFDLSKDIEATEENGISKAQAKADKLAAINGYEQKSVQNHKIMKKGAEDELKAWDEVKKRFEALDDTLTSLTDVLQEGMKIDFETEDAAADITALQEKLNSLDLENIFSEAEGDVEHFTTAIRGVSEAWDDATRDMVTMHSRATDQVLRDLDTIKRKADAVFASAGANYSVSVPGYRLGGLHTGYGGGDQQIAAFERGEYTMPKEVNSHYGTGFLDDIKNMNYPKTGETDVKVVPGSNSTKRSQETMTLSIQFPGNSPDVEVEATPINIVNLKNGMQDYAKFSAQ